jgi:hypothetical protein
MKAIFTQILAVIWLLSLLGNCTPLNDPRTDDTNQAVANARHANHIDVARLCWDICKWPIFAMLSMWSVNSIVSNYWVEKKSFAYPRREVWDRRN